MPVKKRTPRSNAQSRIHPLGKLFFVTLAISLIGLAVIAARRSGRAPTPIEPVARAIATTLELQIALAREGFSPGSVDGALGGQTTSALLAYQNAHELTATGDFDEETAKRLLITDPVYARIELSETDFSKIAPKPQTWVQRGELKAMHYNSALEMIAEHAQADPDLVQQLNPQLKWDQLKAGDQILVPNIPSFRIQTPIAYVRIELSKRTLQAFDRNDQLRFHCPVSIARRIDKRPSGQLSVKVRVEDPNYTFNPAILSATAEREGITSKFIIPPGPNNPVGSVWIGLNLPSYGIHGTPEPEKVGRTESSGCFRLANWNAETLVKAAWDDMPIHVVP